MMSDLLFGDSTPPAQKFRRIREKRFVVKALLIKRAIPNNYLRNIVYSMYGIVMGIWN